MEIVIDPQLDKKLKNIKRRTPDLIVKIVKKLSLFQKEPRNISLRTHKLKGSLKNCWSISIESDIRMIYRISDTKPQKAIFFDIGGHDEVYR